MTANKMPINGVTGTAYRAQDKENEIKTNRERRHS